MKAWLFQDSRQKKNLGESKAPWSVGWLDPDGKRRSKRVGSKSNAEKYRRKLEGELAAGLYQTKSRKTWADFRAEYEAKILPAKATGTIERTGHVFNEFERIAKPVRMESIKTATVDGFIAKRQREQGRAPGSTVSPASVNIALRTLKAAMGVAVDWGYMKERPKFRMMKEPQRIIRPVTAEHFAALYNACDAAGRPSDGNHTPADWWRAFLVTAYMTGWRLRELLHLERRNVDTVENVAILMAAGTKGKRAERLDLNQIVIDHMKTIFGFSPMVFPIGRDCRRFLYAEFAKIQQAAGIKLTCVTEGEHDCTDACHRYGFHDLRRGFATQNEGRISDQALQSLMRHKSMATTQRYIAMARKTRAAADSLYVPEVLRQATRKQAAN